MTPTQYGGNFIIMACWTTLVTTCILIEQNLEVIILGSSYPLFTQMMGLTFELFTLLLYVIKEEYDITLLLLFL